MPFSLYNTGQIRDEWVIKQTKTFSSTKFDRINNIQLLTIEVLDKLWYPPEIPILTEAIAEVNIGIQ